MGYGGYSGYGRGCAGYGGGVSMAADLPLDAVSLVDLAKERGVSGAAIRKRVLKLEADGLIVGHLGANGSKFVSRSAFDFAVGQTGDPVKEASAASAALMRGVEARPVPAPTSATVPAPAGFATVSADGETPAYRDAKARDAHYAAEIKRLTFERENKQLYPVAEVEAAMVRLADVVKEAAKGLVSRAEEGAEALDAGMPAFRRWLALAGDDICRTIASEWRVLATEGETTAALPNVEEAEADEDEA